MKNICTIKKIRMIFNATIVFAIIGGALSFIGSFQVYECVENKCHETFSLIDPDGDMISKIGAETRAPLEGQPCSLCDVPIQFSPEM